MSQTSAQIEAQLDQEKSELSYNLRELEKRAVTAMDWKHHYEKKPGTMLAIAFGGGFVLSLLKGGGRRNYQRHIQQHRLPPAPARGKSEVWDKLKGALVGLVATRVTDFVGRLIPRL
jgi:hypothetical protein